MIAQAKVVEADTLEKAWFYMCRLHALIAGLFMKQSQLW